MLWSRLYARRTERMSSSAVRELLKITEQPDFISLAGGMPAPEVFPVDEVAAATVRVLFREGRKALQYAPTEGYRPLREYVAMQMRVSVNNVLITTGSQQALDLLGKIFIDDGDEVILEAPTYLAAIQAWNPYGATYREIVSDDDGMDVDALEPLLASHRPKFIYCQPNFQNPAGVTLSGARRERLAKMAARHGVPIVEDDPYRALRFEGEHLLRIFHEDAARRPATDQEYCGNVIYLSSFSKILAPGFRLGWIVAPAEVISTLTRAKQSVDLHTSTLNQAVAYEMAASGTLERHGPLIVKTYRERRDAMLAAMDEHFPKGIRWTRPQGGMFVWVALPVDLDAADVLADALALKVAFVPGTPFFPGGGGKNTLRLNFSNATPDRIVEGIARLGQVLRKRCAGREAISR